MYNQILHSYDACIKDCESALQINGTFSKAFNKLAKSYLAMGQLDRATENFEKAADAAPSDEDLLKTRKACKKVVEFEPKYKEAMEKKNYTEAIALLIFILKYSVHCKRFWMDYIYCLIMNKQTGDVPSLMSSLPPTCLMSDKLYIKALLQYSAGSR